MIPAYEALERLREGNRRFASGSCRGESLASETRRAELVTGQNPHAIILGCSDSRVPAEIVFDQGLGDLFVIRVAGNIVEPSQIGSVEFAAERFGTRLVVVLGHSGCGAVMAALEVLARPAPGAVRSPHLRSILDRVRPALEPLLASDPGQDPEALLRQAVRANVRASVDRLRESSDILDRLVDEDGLMIVGAEYALDTGVVRFLDEAAAPDAIDLASAKGGPDRPDGE